MREIDRLTTEKFNIPSYELMESASAACFKAIQARFGVLAGKKAFVLCGKGNNGGDGAGLARLLIEAGVECNVVLFGKVEETRGDARRNFEALNSSFTECLDASAWDAIPKTDYDIVVDALFGTGLTRPVEGIYLTAVEYLLSLRKGSTRPSILSIDIPSGLNADQAEPIGPSVVA